MKHLISNRSLHTLLSGFILILIVGYAVNSQGQEDQQTKQKKEFDQFKNSIQKEFAQFKNKNDSIFLSFLAKSWKTFSLHKEKATRKPKPVKQPSIGNQPDSGENTPSKRVINYHSKTESDILHAPKSNLSNDEISAISLIDFYGQEIPLPELSNQLSLASLNQEEIIEFYNQYLKEEALLASSEEIILSAEALNLNGWGLIQLLMVASENYFAKINDRVLFSWITLLRDGYDVKIGHDRNQIYLLAHFDRNIFNNSYVNIQGFRYYIVPFPGQNFPEEGIQSFENNYPGETGILSLQLDTLPILTEWPYSRSLEYKQDTIKIPLALSLIQFLYTYPSCELRVYFNAPVSESSLSALDPLFRPLLKGKTEKEQVDILLDFVQQSIPYKTDEDQFERENYLFADETLYFPYADCEDRAILFVKLIERYTGLKVIGLDYPDHVTTGISFSKQFQGDFLIFEGIKYYICDPTYLGAKSGMAMKEFENMKPTVIKIY